MKHDTNFRDQGVDPSRFRRVDVAAHISGTSSVTAHITGLSSVANIGHVVADALSPLDDVTFKLSPLRPPPTAKYLFLLVPKKYRECAIGDLEEEYRTILLPQYGPTKAKLYFWVQVLWSLAVFASNPILKLGAVGLLLWRYIKK